MILPISDPPIIGYQHYAYRMSVLGAHPDFLNWLYCNYIQLVWIREPKGFPRLDFYEFQKIDPFMNELYVHKSTITPYVSLLTFIKDRLDEGRYVITFVNEYYLPERAQYLKKHNVHDIMIYGYQDDEEMFVTAGFNQDAMYSTSKFSYACMEKALLDMDQAGKFLKEWSDGIHLLCLFEGRTFSLDISVIAEQLEEYLHAVNSSSRFRMFSPKLEQPFGMAIYDELVNYLQHIDIADIDVRMFHILYEHKKLMYERLVYLQEHAGVHLNPTDLESCKNILERALALRNLCIRLMMLNEGQLIERMVALVRKIEDAERQTLPAVLQALQVTQ